MVINVINQQQNVVKKAGNYCNVQNHIVNSVNNGRVKYYRKCLSVNSVITVGF